MADEDNGQDVRDDESDAPPAPPAWKAPASAAELNEIIEKRLQRERAKFKDYDQLKSKAQRADELESANATDLEKAAKTARDEGRAEALREATPRLVKAEFRAAAKGVLTREQLDSLLEDIDLGRFVTEDGDVDEAKIGKKIESLAPPKKDDEEQQRFPDLGGGNRGKTSTVTNMNDRIRQLAGHQR